MPASMTRKHFEALAAALRSTRIDDPYNEDKKLALDAASERIASVCARFNPTFDRARFIAACGVQEG